LIYFSDTFQTQAFDRFADLLNPKAFFFSARRNPPEITAIVSMNYSNKHIYYQIGKEIRK